MIIGYVQDVLKGYFMITEFAKMVLGIGLLVHLNSWFGLEQFIPMGATLVMLYLIISMLAAIYFSYFDRAKVIAYAA